ncbi:MAG: tRNA (adenosine(37)-N6)-threonylcarbamoyltransferase complex dimerization subunit type 1 TsaB [Bacteroidales bacterium]|nr:tRNA (adenosine(37)-N6)-threonylcarbamoyltransferase complex dimerization subunit type 1 TsaB [Bacteroidales bacterium]MDD4703461.1 tRNA (adenosine(37)-N6)-threonylcarbamoyltransferase complex dimerization subunit type 1 TsaB [Bacteroidales bacterium]
MQPLILLLETSTEICSVALAKGRDIISKRSSSEVNSHSKMLSIFIEQVINESSIPYKELSAIAISKGPGSYTGLRIGVSSAKGLAYALDIPLISIETLRILEKGVKEKYPNANTVAMIDAKRMEVYCEIYDSKGNVVKPLSADIIDKGIYQKYIDNSSEYVFVGNGAKKTMSFFEDKSNCRLDEEVFLDATLMSEMAQMKYFDKDFEDVAYFEPYYLKDFVAVESKVKGLR